MIATDDTIAAISTAASNAGIGIIRISGREALGIVDKIFVSPFGKKAADAAPQTILYGHITDEAGVIDEVLVSVMKAPHSYTKENVAEINCHGGMYVLNKVLELVLKNGARAAEPGEFTKRAYLNGRIDLAEAEAVMDLIDAESGYALQSAAAQLKGSVSFKIRGLRAEILERTAYIEAALDDPEHIEMKGYEKELSCAISRCRDEIQALIDTYDDGRIIKEGIRTAIVGRPNVGKSSTLNALLGSERAIVTDIPGTTRDTLNEQIRLGDLFLNIADTAGIRETDDVIEKIGAERAAKCAEEADLVILVTDAAAGINAEDKKIAGLIKNKRVIILLNKQDLGSVVLPEDAELVAGAPVIEISAKDGTGMDALASCVKEMFIKKDIDFNNQVCITNARHKVALCSAKASLENVLKSIDAGLSEDFLTIDMMGAYEALGTIIGEALEDDLADEIFSKFCMGK